MSVTVLTEDLGASGAGRYIVSEANGYRSRATIVIVNGQNLKDGAVLGKISSGGKYAAYDNGAGDGTEVAAGILYGACDASGGDQAAVAHVRDCEVNEGELIWDSGQDANDKAAAVVDLTAAHVIIRASSPPAA
jgi:hypothetical protein